MARKPWTVRRPPNSDARAAAARAILLLVPTAFGLALMYGAVLLFTTRQTSTPTEKLTVYANTRHGSPYDVFAKYLALRLRAAPAIAGIQLAIEEQETAGSLETLAKVEGAKVALGEFGIGLSQSDVLYHYIRGGHPQLPVAKESSDVRAVARLFPEWIDVAIRSAPLGALTDATQACAEDIGSGSFVTAVNIGRALDLPWASNIRPCKKTSSVLPPNGALVSIQVSSPPLEYGAAKESFGRIGLTSAMAATVVSAFPQLYTGVDVVDYFNTYGPSGGNTSVSIDTILVTNRELPAELAESIRCILDDLDRDVCGTKIERRFDCDDGGWKAGNEIRNRWFVDEMSRFRYCGGIAKLPDIDRKERRFSKLPVNRLGASVGPDLDVVSRALIGLNLLPLASIAMLVFGLSLVVVTWAKREASVLHKATHGLLKLLLRWKWQAVAFLVAHVLVAVVIWVAEFHSDALLSNSEFVGGGVGGAIRWVVRFISTGENPYQFQSNMALVGLASLKGGWAALSIGFTIGITKQVVRYLQTAKMSNHTIVIGWNERGQDVLRELSVLGSEIFLVGFREWTNLPDVDLQKLVVSDLDVDQLKVAAIGKASVVVVLGDSKRFEELGDAEVDIWTARVVGLVRRAERAIGKTFPARIVAEVLRPANCALVRTIGEAPNMPESCEVSCMQQWGARYLAQMTVNPTIAPLFEALSKTAPNSYELYHLTFDELGKRPLTLAFLRRITAGPDSRADAIPIAIKRSSTILFAPDQPIEAGDSVLFLAENRDSLVRGITKDIMDVRPSERPPARLETSVPAGE